MKQIFIAGIVLLGMITAVSANDALLDNAEFVTIRAQDRATLHASYFPPITFNSEQDAPAVLLLHQLYTNRHSWNTLIPELRAAGYAVLAPDLRGYGQSRGDIDWRKAQEDTLLWLAWLSEQPNVDPTALIIVGSSMGANLAVIGCADARAADLSCLTAIAISPGMNYFGYTPLIPALEGELAETPVLFLTAQGDNYAARAAETLSIDFVTVNVSWRTGNAHGIDLLDSTTRAEMIGWLNNALP